MSDDRASLVQVSTGVLERVRTGIATGALRTPVHRELLIGFGVRDESLATISQVLGGLSRAACLAVLDVALAERDGRTPTPELVWTGPEAPAATARDTSIVLRELFEGARESVILAGYSFENSRDLLAPLHRSMVDHGVEARLFVHVPQVEGSVVPETYLAKHLGGFVAESWPFGAPWPRIYYDKRSLVPGPPYSSLHAKCVVVDGARAFVSSANFTQRAQERNIEVGVLLEDPSFARFLAAQWLGLVETGLVAEYVGAT